MGNATLLAGLVSGRQAHRLRNVGRGRSAGIARASRNLRFGGEKNGSAAFSLAVDSKPRLDTRRQGTAARGEGASGGTYANLVCLLSRRRDAARHQRSGRLR